MPALRCSSLKSKGLSDAFLKLQSANPCGQSKLPPTYFMGSARSTCEDPMPEHPDPTGFLGRGLRPSLVGSLCRLKALSAVKGFGS